MEIDLEDEEKIIIYSLGALDGTPLKSKIKLQKLLFLFSNVFDSYKELLEFEPHLFGPYSETINQLIEDLETLGIIDIDGNKYKLTKNDMHNLKRLMLIYTLEGSKAKNGVYYNKYRNWKQKGQLCLKQLLQ